jgi:hypothetical protein
MGREEGDDVRWWWWRRRRTRRRRGRKTWPGGADGKKEGKGGKETEDE